MTEPPGGWSDDDTRDFLAHADVFVPGRAEQLATLCRLVPEESSSHVVVDVGCGAGRLTQSLLELLPEVEVLALDGSEPMLEKARHACASHAQRLTTRRVDLADPAWRRELPPARAVLSSLALHHLDDAGKWAFFADVARVLVPGGCVLVADLVRPSNERGRKLAETAWNEAARRQSLARDGTLHGFQRFRELKWNWFAESEPDPVDQPAGLLAQLGWLEDVGLVEPDVYWMKAGHAVFGAWKPAAPAAAPPAERPSPPPARRPRGTFRLGEE